LLAARSLPSPRTHWRKHRRLRRRASGRSFAYNLRFPGQYYQTETGLNQNVNRDYDPLTGKYIESDPIGLAAGSNTYLYALADPVMMWDQYGLMSDDDCCARSMALGQNTRPPSTGWVICCEGRTVPCAYDPNAPQNDRARSIRKKCSLAHERTHLNQIPCTNCTPDPVRPNFLPGVDQDNAECIGNTAGVTCLKASLNQCGSDAVCRNYVMGLISFYSQVAASKCRSKQ
jgi:RHS repeat-associated protein